MGLILARRSGSINILCLRHFGRFFLQLAVNIVIRLLPLASEAARVFIWRGWPLLGSLEMAQGFTGFLTGGTALGMSSLSKFNCGVFSCPFNLGASRSPEPPTFGTGILTVANSAVRRRMA